MNIQVVMPSTTHSTHVYAPVVHTLNGSILDKVIIHTSSWIHWKVILAPKCLTKPKCAIWIFVGVSNLNLIYDFSMWGAMRLLVKLTRYESLDFFKVFFGGDLWCICSPNYLVLGGLECSLLGAISPVKWLRFDLSMSKIHNKGPYKKKGSKCGPQRAFDCGATFLVDSDNIFYWNVALHGIHMKSLGKREIFLMKVSSHPL